MSTKKKTKVTPKKTVVTRKFMLDLANKIYNPKNKTFLRLCDGTLQNGPDPTNPKRVMHCGLGELWFAMTGTQPEDVNANEEDVVEEACELSKVFNKKHKQEKVDRAQSTIEKLDLPRGVKDRLLDVVQFDFTNEEEEEEEDFRAALEDIPNENDDGCGHSPTDSGNGLVCTVKDFQARSKRVANQLRIAAKLLP